MNTKSRIHNFSYYHPKTAKLIQRLANATCTPYGQGTVVSVDEILGQVYVVRISLFDGDTKTHHLFSYDWETEVMYFNANALDIIAQNITSPSPFPISGKKVQKVEMPEDEAFDILNKYMEELLYGGE